MITIAFAQQKGGVGKTTSCAAIGEGLRRQNNRILYVDLDPQCNLSVQFEVQEDAPTISDVIAGKCTVHEALQRTEKGAILPASRFLSYQTIAANKQKEYCLKSILAPLKKDFDYCLVDCPPALNSLTVAALTACTGVIIPCKADRFSLNALEEITETIEAVKRNTNKGIQIYGILITMFNGRTVANRMLLDIIKDKADMEHIYVYDPPIRKSVAAEEAQYGTIYDSRNAAAEDYSNIVKKILEQTKGE